MSEVDSTTPPTTVGKHPPPITQASLKKPRYERWTLAQAEITQVSRNQSDTDIRTAKMAIMDRWGL